MRLYNQFFKGINSDTNVKFVGAESITCSQNILLFDEGENGVAVNIPGTKHVSGISGSQIRSIKTNGFRNGETVPGALLFVRKENGDSALYFFDQCEGECCELLTGLCFPEDMCISGFNYSEGDCHTVYWVDGKNELRKIEVSCDIEHSLKKICARPLDPIDCIELSGVREDGFLLGGSYQVAYRYYNKKDCYGSGFSNFTNPIHVASNCGDGKNQGACVNDPTNRSIVLSIPTAHGQECYDSVQLLIVKNNDGTKEIQTTGFLLDPVDFSNEYTYTGDASEVSQALSEVLIDKLAINGAEGIAVADNRAFYFNPLIQEFEGQPKITGASLVKRKLGERVVCPPVELCIKSTNTVPTQYLIEWDFVGEFDYASIRFYDQLFGEFFLTHTVTGQSGEETLGAGALTEIEIVVCKGDSITKLRVPFVFEEAEVKHTIELEQEYCVMNDEVESSNSKSYQREELRPFGLRYYDKYGNSCVFPLDLSEYSDSESWAYKFPELCDCPLFDSDGDLTSLGIKLSGITDHPEWAVRMDVVQRKRIRDIVYQVPHIPLVGVQGVNTPYQFEEGAFPCQDYDGEKDFAMPKIFRMGAARNLVRTNDNDVVNVPDPFLASLIKRYQYPSWEIQCTETGANEISDSIFVPAPEVVCGDNGESYRLEDTQGLQVEIAGAVVWNKQTLYEDIEDDFDEDERDPRQRLTKLCVNTYSACEPAQYSFNKEEVKQEEEICVRTQKIQPLAESGLEGDADYFSGSKLGNMNWYGCLNLLALQQYTNPSIRAIEECHFNPQAKNQPGLILSLDKKLKDLAAELQECPNIVDLTIDPLAYEDNPLVIAELQNNVYDEANERNVDNEIPFGECTNMNASYILNIKKGLGDDRYGDIGSTSTDWYTTGACVPIADSGELIDIEVFGGETFITKHRIKLHESTPKINFYKPIEQFIGEKQEDGSFDQNVMQSFALDAALVAMPAAKVGAYQRNIEILELYLESDINGELICNKPDKSLSSIDSDWICNYNAGYSATNELKLGATKPEVCKTNRNTYGWSDQRIRGLESTKYDDNEGFNCFRVNNTRAVDGQFGDIVDIQTLGNNDLYIFQQCKIRFEPLGIDLARDADGVQIALGTSEVIGNGGYYAGADIGVHSPRAIQKRDGRFFGVDAKRCKMWEFGTRFNGFRFTSDDKWDTKLREFIHTETKWGEEKIGKNDLWTHMDLRGDRLLIARRGKGMLVYNVKAGILETIIDKEIDDAFCMEKHTYFIKDGQIEEWYEGERGVLFGKQCESWVEFIVFGGIDRSMLKSIEINSQKKVDYIQVWAFNEDYEDCEQGSKKLSLQYRDHTQYNNVIRSSDGRRLYGECFKVRVYWTNKKKVKLHGVSTYL